MGSDRLKTLVLTLVSFGCLVWALWFGDWFVIEVNGMIGGTEQSATAGIGLRNVHVCDQLGQCITAEFRNKPLSASFALGAGSIFAAFVGFQGGARVLTDTPASDSLSKFGWLIGIFAGVGVVMFGYLFTPDQATGSAFGIGFSLSRGNMGWISLVGIATGMVALHYAATEASLTDVPSTDAVLPTRAANKTQPPPVQVGAGSPPPGRTKSDSLALALEPSPPPKREKPDSIPFDMATYGRPDTDPPAREPASRVPVTEMPLELTRKKSPTEPPIELTTRTKGQTQQQLVDQMRSKSPTRHPDPARPKSPTQGPEMPRRAHTPSWQVVGGQMVQVEDTPAVDHEALRGKLQFAMHTATLTRAGVEARREDATNVLVMWRDVVGIVVRKAPPELGGVEFCDLISTAGSTLRLVPWTHLEGDLIEGDGEQRLRNYLAAVIGYCPDVQLDRATRDFVEKIAAPAQLPDVRLLAAHDARLA